MLHEVSAGVILFYVDRKGTRQYLLIKSGTGKQWLFPKGIIEKGEDSFEAARREVAEEIGVRSFSTVHDFRRTSRYIYKKKGKTVSKVATFFLGKLKSKNIRLSCEHEDYMFVSVDELDKKEHKFAYKFIKEADKFLNKSAREKIKRKGEYEY